MRLSLSIVACIILLLRCDNSKKFNRRASHLYYHIEAYNGNHLYAALLQERDLIHGHLFSKQNGFIQVKGRKTDSIYSLIEYAPSGNPSGKYTFMVKPSADSENWYSIPNDQKKYEMKWNTIDSANFYSKVSFLSVNQPESGKPSE